MNATILDGDLLKMYVSEILVCASSYVYNVVSLDGVQI